MSCPKTMLDPAESMDCTATGTAAQGQYQNLGSVTALSPSNRSASDTDPSHYLGQVSGTGDCDREIDQWHGCRLPAWAENPGRYRHHLDLRRHQHRQRCPHRLGRYRWSGVAVTCPQSTSAVGESMTCTASGVSAAGQYSNIGRVTASPPTGPDINGADSSHYFGESRRPRRSISRNSPTVWMPILLRDRLSRSAIL